MSFLIELVIHAIASLIFAPFEAGGSRGYGIGIFAIILGLFISWWSLTSEPTTVEDYTRHSVRTVYVTQPHEVRGFHFATDQGEFVYPEHRVTDEERQRLLSLSGTSGVETTIWAAGEKITGIESPGVWLDPALTAGYETSKTRRFSIAGFCFAGLGLLIVFLEWLSPSPDHNPNRLRLKY